MFMPTVHLLIKGKVQGVFYRAAAKEKAGQLKLTGWIKNTAEGAVEAMASGADESIKAFIEWCKMGPSQAVVTSVQTTALADQNFNDFHITRD
jgi:acylphosphatase